MWKLTLWPVKGFLRGMQIPGAWWVGLLLYGIGVTVSCFLFDFTQKYMHDMIWPEDPYATAKSGASSTTVLSASPRGDPEVPVSGASPRGGSPIPVRDAETWAMNTRAPNGSWGCQSDVRHTSFTVMALSEQGYDVSEATAWLVDQQSPDGRWDDLESTCYALWALAQVGMANQEAVDYLWDAQAVDGSWGDPLTTSLAVLALNNAGEVIPPNTLDWLLAAQNADGRHRPNSSCCREMQ